MIPSPRRTVSTPAVHSWPDVDDDDGWQDMPVVRSEDNPLGLDEEDQRKFHYRAPDRLDDASDRDRATGTGGNATGTHLEVEADTLLTESWRDKISQDESDYTRLRLDEDEESEEVAMRTKYLFDEDKAMTPLSQMQATKNLLTEGQRIAYVGLCQLIARQMIRDMGRGWEGYKAKRKLGLKGKKGEVPVVENGQLWMLKIMARLYQHMELTRDEQRMIESLAEHGVDPSDLVPALMTTHTVNNPDFDPKAKARADLQAIAEAEAEGEAEAEREMVTEKERFSNQVEANDKAEGLGLSAEGLPTDSPPPPPYSPRKTAEVVDAVPGKPTSRPRKTINPFGEDDDGDEGLFDFPSASSSKRTSSIIPSTTASVPIARSLPSFDDEDDDGDISSMLSPQAEAAPQKSDAIKGVPAEDANGAAPAFEPEKDPEKTPRVNFAQPQTSHEGFADPDDAAEAGAGEKDVEETEAEAAPAPLPSLPGVSTSLSNIDEVVTLDIRWTVLCDLFLVLIADSVYDARSRAFLEHVAVALGFEWLDLVRFENRVTDALDIQESAEKTGQEVIIEGRMKSAKTKRYALMGLAAVGGGLVIGLSAGLAAPLIGAGLGAALGTVGITGTGTFLAGAGGIAMITTGGVLTGANIAGKGMAKRTREVRTFEFKPLHNNKRVTCYITMGGFMASTVDDVRLPFSVLDPVVGDVYSVHWEPEMMAEMGSALKIFGSEILTQVGQQVLSATIMTALMSALQWPLILTKLGYLIDNPWSNALDRARAAGLVLADTILHRHAGIRPISLIGFSLGARAIFYALIELARVGAYGLVQDVFLFGTTVTASKATWLDVRSVVAGRFVNGYATNDWMLGYLFRATSGGLNTVAGLRPVDAVARLENVDVTEIITGHMSYRSCMPQLLAKVGFPTTSDYFDEPEDPEIDMSVQERTIVNEAEEEAKRNRRKVLGIFPIKDKSARSSTSGTSTPVQDKEQEKSTSSPVPVPGPGGGYEYEDDEDLPPREEADLGDISGKSAEEDQAARKRARDAEAAAIKAEEEAVKAIPKTAGFDFTAISRELGKDIDVDKLRQPEPRQKRDPLPELESRVPLERSGSAPPVHVSAPPPEENAWGSAAGGSSIRHASLARFASEDDDAGDITGSMTRNLSIADIPAWERPNLSSFPSPAIHTGSSPPPASPSSSSGLFRAPAFAWNAWGSGSTGAITTTAAAAVPARAAPPARPHPAEFMGMESNPFAATPGGGAVTGSGGWSGGFDLEAIKAKERKRREDEDMAESNPW
ncbi:hypothetical protein IAU60_000917 [Kwoniella sp. DSM 27419]